MAVAGFRVESMSVSINFKAYDTRSGASVAAADLLADLLKVAGIVVMAVFYTLWGVWEGLSLPPAPLP